MRRALTFVIVALGTAAASSAWLYDGDLAAAVSPVLPKGVASMAAAKWNADQLAAEQGIVPAAAPLPESPLGAPETPADPPADGR